MNDMERRRLQAYARTARLATLRSQIEVLEFFLAPLYAERDLLEQAMKTPSPRADTRPARRTVRRR